MKNHFNEILKSEFQFVKLIHKSDKAECVLYRHKKLNKSIVVHKLNNAHVDVYSVLKRIRHDNIAEVYDAFEIDGKTVVVEEYINGITLSELTDTMSPLGVKRIIIQLCSGLSALHSLGIVHRDITLNNIMLTDSGTVKIIDFDIAKLYTAADTVDSDTMGTVGFAPFEQLGLNKTDERSDIFAVGVVANLLLTGKHPSVHMFTKGRLGKIIRTCTSIDPRERFSSADEILENL
ncbi:MAG: serine/threonine protein kinase [Ruminococcus sp.]|nr:serine/threonine protein kinase [Ruminococcus sp.]